MLETVQNFASCFSRGLFWTEDFNDPVWMRFKGVGNRAAGVSGDALPGKDSDIEDD